MASLSSWLESTAKQTNHFFIALALITLLGAGLRLVKLGEYPGGFGQDEAVNLYDAWSLMTTGADHHGLRWPLNTEQFGDFPSALQAYITIPFVALFGPTEFAARFPCALLNAAAIPLFGLLLFRLFLSRAAGLFGALLLALSPWNIYFSRWAVSPGFVTFFNIAGLYLLLRLFTGEPTNPKRHYRLAILTGITLFFWAHQYLSQYFFAPPMIALAMLIWYRRNWGRVLVSGGVFSLFMLAAILPRIGNSSTSGRLHRECVFFGDHVISTFWHNYREYLSFRFLFNAPEMLALHQIPGVAHIQHLLSPFYLAGIAVLLAAIVAPVRLLALLNRPNDPESAAHWRRTSSWMLAGLLLAPLVGAMFVQQMYTSRMTHLLVQVTLLTAVGCAACWYLLKQLPWRAAAPLFALALTLYLGQQTVKTFRGLVRSDTFLKEYLQQGVPDVMRYLASQPNVRSVKFPRMLQGYIYHLLFTPVNPSKLNTAEVTPSTQDNPNALWHYIAVPRVGNYYFDQTIDSVELSRTCTLKHQVIDHGKVWYDLYENNGNWFVAPHEYKVLK